MTVQMGTMELSGGVADEAEDEVAAGADRRKREHLQEVGEQVVDEVDQKVDLGLRMIIEQVVVLMHKRIPHNHSSAGLQLRLYGHRLCDRDPSSTIIHVESIPLQYWILITLFDYRLDAFP
jgi:hypothetical protein